MLRPLLSVVLLLFLAFGLAGMNILMIQTALAESADDDVSPETQEDQTLTDYGARQFRAHGKRLPRSLNSRANPPSTANEARSPFTSLSPPHCGTGNFHGLLQIFRI